MGISRNGKSFSADVLRVEISGPKQAHLTLVDLPGLFHSASTSHTDDDRDAVNALVTQYISRPRCIILTVVSAKNDIQNQAILGFARKHDADGTRTLGIITKPDTLAANSPSECSYIKLAQNTDVVFALGWHVVRNRSWVERETSSEQRDQVEREFFDTGAWKAINHAEKGVQSLRMRLSQILYNHIVNELPSLLEEIDHGVIDCERRLQGLGGPRGTPEQQRLYLLQASQRFGALTKAAVEGMYTDPFFGSSLSDDGYHKRLCAVSMSILKDFAKKMHDKGHAVKLVEKIDKQSRSDPSLPQLQTYASYYEEVQRRMRRNGGRELPGLYNPSLVRDLFFDQARPWQRLIDGAKDELVEATRISVELILQDSADAATATGILRHIINPAMEALELTLAAKAEEVLRPHLGGEVMTFNHYFTENIMAKRAEKARKHLNATIIKMFGRDPDDEDPSKRRFEGPIDVQQLRDAFEQQSEPNMERFAAIECVDAMESYYKVALKSIIDNFSLYAVNTSFLSEISRVFTPEVVLGLDGNIVRAVAGESQHSALERESLSKKLAVLKKTQKVLGRLDRQQSGQQKALATRSINVIGASQEIISQHDTASAVANIMNGRGSLESQKNKDIQQNKQDDEDDSGSESESESSSDEPGYGQHPVLCVVVTNPPTSLDAVQLPLGLRDDIRWPQYSSGVEERAEYISSLPRTVTMTNGTRITLFEYIYHVAWALMSISPLAKRIENGERRLRALLKGLFWFQNVRKVFAQAQQFMHELRRHDHIKELSADEITKISMEGSWTCQDIFPGCSLEKITQSFETHVGYKFAHDSDE